MATRKSKAASTVAAAVPMEFVLVLRTCNAKLQSHGGFQWPAFGGVSAPDWKPKAECGNGLHGWLWGAGARGTATAGDAGTATAGDAGTATAGEGGVIAVTWYDEKKNRYRVAMGYVGEDGIRAGVGYCVRDGKLVEKEVAQ